MGAGSSAAQEAAWTPQGATPLTPHATLEAAPAVAAPMGDAAPGRVENAPAATPDLSDDAAEGAGEGESPATDFPVGVLKEDASLPKEILDWNPKAEAPDQEEEEPTPFPTPPELKPVANRSGLALLPTAYVNRLGKESGVNLDLLFSYYIGSIVERGRDDERTQLLNPLRLWLFTVDFKYTPFVETETRPAGAVGLLNTLLLEGSSPGATGSGGQGLRFTASSLGSLYLALGKSLSETARVHAGYLRGNLRDPLDGVSFLRRFFPNRNHGELLALFSEDLEEIRGEKPPNIVYTGGSFKALGTDWAVEVWKPFPYTLNPILVNTKIEKLFSFNLSYSRWDGGYSLLGYFNFRFTILPPEKERKPGLANF